MECGNSSPKKNATTKPGWITLGQDRIAAVTYSGGSSGDYFGCDAAGKPLRKIQQTGGVNYQTSATYNLAHAITTEMF